MMTKLCPTLTYLSIHRTSLSGKFIFGEKGLFLCDVLNPKNEADKFNHIFLQISRRLMSHVASKK